MLHAILAAAALLAAADEDPQAKVVVAAAQAMATGHPDVAIATVDPALAAYDKQFAGEKRRIVCAYTPEDTLLNLLGAAADKTDAIAVTGSWCDALFIKGFSLVDLHRYDKGVPLLERATTMAPHRAHFLNELGYAYQQQKRWDQSFAAFARAADATAFSDKARVTTEKGRALRGMGYALIEQGKWDEAEKLYRECLAMDPDDVKAKNELQFIAEQRARPKT